MSLENEELKVLIKNSVKEALTEFFGNEEQQEKDKAPPSKSSDTAQKKEASAAENSQGTPTYEELFHRIMSQVARGSIDTQTAGKLLADAYETFGKEGDKAPEQGQQKERPQEPSSKTHDILMKIAQWESEMSGITGEVAESTLEMMERMRDKIEHEVAKMKGVKDDADLYKASKEMEKEEQEKRTASKIKEMKDKIAADKK